MREKLVKITPPPGLYRNGTRYQAANRWFDANGIRFIDGTIRPIGGWRRAQTAASADIPALTGTPRGSLAWRGSDGTIRIAIGTHSKLYAIVEGSTFDITPSGFVAGSVDSSYVTGGGAYGAGLYGSGPYGSGSVALTLDEADTWQLDIFGDFLVACCTSDGKIYTWDGNTANIAVVATDSPKARAVVVTPERFLVAIGAEDSPGVPDVRRVAWATQEGGISVAGDWTPLPTNTAGDLPIATPGRLVAGRRTRRQTLIWSDTDLTTLTYIGGTFIYQWDQAGDNCGLIAPNAVAIVDTQAFWMGTDSFFMFDGFVRPVPCEVRDYVFGSFNKVQAAKVFAVPVSAYGEITWFYPSGTASECDRYVTYSYRENHWTTGTLSRATGFDRGATPRPMLVTSDGLIYEHELTDTPFDHTGLGALFLESGPFELDDGDNVLRIQRIVPDERTLGDVRAFIFTSFFPTQAETQNGPYTLDNPTDVRITARQARLRVEQVQATDWRVGTLRVGVLPGGRR